MSITLPKTLQQWLKQPVYCHIATLMPDGAPHTTITWVDTDGQYILINTVEGYRKLRNVKQDPRVSLNIVDPNSQAHIISVRGRVVEITTEGATEHIETLAQRYLGRSYPYGEFGSASQQRVLLKIAAEKIVE